MNAKLCGISLLFTAACHAHPAAPASPSSDLSNPDYCGMALSALRTTVASNDAQPYGLEDVCVRRLASTGGAIFVDARVSERAGGPPIAALGCTSDGFRIRFDPARFEKAPTDGVVLLVISRTPDGAMGFNAVVENADWPSKRPGGMSLSPCGSAFGTIRRTSAGWEATVVPPPRSPDAL